MHPDYMLFVLILVCLENNQPPPSSSVIIRSLMRNEPRKVPFDRTHVPGGSWYAQGHFPTARRPCKLRWGEGGMGRSGCTWASFSGTLRPALPPPPGWCRSCAQLGSSVLSRACTMRPQFPLHKHDCFRRWRMLTYTALLVSSTATHSGRGPSLLVLWVPLK